MIKKIFIYIIILLVSCISFLVLTINYISIHYPIKYLSTIHKYSIEFNLDVPLILSIINVESNFKQNAVSKANAIGLMQLKFDTALDMAKQCKDNNLTLELLFDYEYNIKYGCAYLRYLFDYYKNFDNAIAAYNAGLGNVNSWLENPKLTDNNGQLIDIPFEETKNYLLKIKRNLKIYNHFEKIGKLKINIIENNNVDKSLQNQYTN